MNLSWPIFIALLIWSFVFGGQAMKAVIEKHENKSYMLLLEEYKRCDMQRSELTEP